MATKEQLTYTDVRNAASQADALEAVSNYMNVQQRRRTGYTTKADPTQKWHTGQTFTDHDGRVYQLRVQYAADGSIRNQQKHYIGEGKVPKPTTAKTPLTGEQVAEKVELFGQIEGVDSPEVVDYVTRLTQIQGVGDPVIQASMYAEIDRDLNISSGYDEPKAEARVYTPEGVQKSLDAYVQSSMGKEKGLTDPFVMDFEKAIQSSKVLEGDQQHDYLKDLLGKIEVSDVFRYQTPSDEKIPILDFEQVKLKLAAYKRVSGTDPEEAKHFDSRVAEYEAETDPVLKANILAALNSDIDIASGYNEPKAAVTPEITYKNVEARYNAIKGSLNAGQQAWAKERLQSIKTLEADNPVAFQQEIDSFSTKLNSFGYKAPKDTGRVYSVKGVTNILNTYITAAGLNETNPSVVRYRARFKAIDAMPESDEKQAALKDAESDVFKDVAFDYKDPKATTKFTDAGVQAVISSVTNPDKKAELQIKYNKVVKMKDGKSKQTRLSHLVADVGQIEKVKVEDEDKVTASDVLDYRTMGKTFETLAKRGFREANPGYSMEMEEPPKITEEMVNYYRLAREGKIRTDLAGDHKVYKGQVVISPEDIDMNRHVGSELHLAFQNSPEAKNVPANLSESEAINKVKQAFYDYTFRIQKTTPSQSYFQLFIDKAPDREWFTREQSIYEKIQSIR